MDWADPQTYLIPALIAAYFGWRIISYRRTRARLPAILSDGAIVVDVRSPGEFAAGANPNSVNIPLAELDDRCGELDKSKTVVLCCASGTRSGMGVAILRRKGFTNVMNAGPWTNTLVG